MREADIYMWYHLLSFLHKDSNNNNNSNNEDGANKGQLSYYIEEN